MNELIKIVKSKDNMGIIIFLSKNNYLIEEYLWRTFLVNTLDNYIFSMKLSSDTINVVRWHLEKENRLSFIFDIEVIYFKTYKHNGATLKL